MYKQNNNIDNLFLSYSIHKLKNYSIAKQFNYLLP